ncbi:Nucleotide-binding universal stress protein, UspA family [Natronoarchaeum philippinense]|uniref:Nucleotide-binding universal stress protein, UspA family n=1 Tax=Natronoarchaeum philippinense TaxID=558529 RepID=A0A285P405_NATPI|nr:universal stress protein [Natronoarchaeum philippinense]SNZ16188.1 Nucleotide-binding universal stress protein, UspA family [Natronoarchaeum philippinense]
MTTPLFERALVPLASEDDARSTCRAIEPHLPEDCEIVAVHVIEKAGGAPDKASVEQREDVADHIFEIVTDRFPDRNVSTDVLYGTDVADTIIEYGGEVDASVVAFTPREAGRLVRLLTGDTMTSMVTETDRPVLVLPDPDDE